MWSHWPSRRTTGASTLGGSSVPGSAVIVPRSVSTSVVRPAFSHATSASALDDLSQYARSSTVAGPWPARYRRAMLPERPLAGQLLRLGRGDERLCPLERGPNHQDAAQRRRAEQPVDARVVVARVDAFGEQELSRFGPGEGAVPRDGSRSTCISRSTSAGANPSWPNRRSAGFSGRSQRSGPHPGQVAGREQEQGVPHQPGATDGLALRLPNGLVRRQRRARPHPEQAVDHVLGLDRERALRRVGERGRPSLVQQPLRADPQKAQLAVRELRGLRHSARRRSGAARPRRRWASGAGPANPGGAISR